MNVEHLATGIALVLGTAAAVISIRLQATSSSNHTTDSQPRSNDSTAATASTTESAETATEVSPTAPGAAEVVIPDRLSYRNQRKQGDYKMC